MNEFAKRIRERAEKVRCDMGELTQDMEDELRSMFEVIKEKAEKFRSEIKNRME